MASALSPGAADHDRPHRGVTNRTANYTKPPYNEILAGGPPAFLGPVAQESVVDSALLRSIFRPFKPAFLSTTCTQNRPRGTCHITSGLPVRNEAARAADATREVVERWLPSG